jgi:choline dehydrogenase-like flavoprotein
MPYDPQYGIGNSRIFFGRLRYIMGQPPSDKSGVDLLEAKDKYGLPKISIKSHVDNIVFRSANEFQKILADEVGDRIKIHSFEIKDQSDMAKRMYMYPSHHIGTTPMGITVDKNCKLLNSDSIYVAGCSTFPTGGHAPPTLTIVAMALRLASHLKDRL